MSSPLYPVLLDLRGRRCVVVGGGAVARRKASALSQSGARVTVVAPVIDPRLALLPNVEALERGYRSGDLAGACLAVAATDDPAVNRQVARDAGAAGVWVNVADRSATSSFIVPAVVRRGPVLAAVSSAGASPALAARIRDIVADALDPAYGPFAELLAEQRVRVQEAVDDPGARAHVLRQMASDEVFDCFRGSGPDAAAEMIRHLIAAAKQK